MERLLAIATTACLLMLACGGSNDEEEATPSWTDPTSSLTWQNPPADKTMDWKEAEQYCGDLSLDDGDWRLPTISELRTLIRGCPGTVTGGACRVTDSCFAHLECWDEEFCSGCSARDGSADGCFWPDEMQGTCSWYRSSSDVMGGGGGMWSVAFNDGGINSTGGLTDDHVRCVR